MRVLFGFLIAVILLLQYVIADVANVSLSFDPSLDPTKGDVIQFEGLISEPQRKFRAYTSGPGRKKYVFKTEGYLKFEGPSALSEIYSFTGYVGDNYLDMVFRNSTTHHKMILLNGGYDHKRDTVEGFLHFID